MARFIAGKFGRITVGAATLAGREWDVAYQAENVDTTNFETAPKRQGITGPEELDWSFVGHWDCTRNLLQNPPGMYPRDDGELMSIFPRRSLGNGTAINDTVKWSMPLWRCLNSKMKCNAEGMVSFDSSGKSQGDFSTPQGNINA